MNEQAIKSMAQAIVAMSAEEKKLLETMVDDIEGHRKRDSDSESHDLVSNQSSHPQSTEPTDSHRESLRSFFETMESLQIEGGPPDWSERINDYLIEDALSLHDD